MNKLKLFIENFLVYGFGGVISKVIPLIMVPIVTRIMPNSSYFGINDLTNTIVSFASALAIMGMYDAMYRMFFEKDDEEFKKEICSTTLSWTILTSIIISFLLVIFRQPIAKLFYGTTEYSFLLYFAAITTLVSSTNGIISAPTRMQNKRKIFLITNTISPILSYSISIPLLLKGYYLIALPLAGVVSGMTMEVAFYLLNKSWFDFRKNNGDLLKKLLIFAVPLIPNFLIYWLFNSADRVMISNLMDVGAAGIYSVGSKLGHASQLIYTAFAGGWQYFAFATMKEDNQVKSNSLIFEYLGGISYVATAFICAFAYVFYDILFVDEYLPGYVISPYLFLAPLLQMLFQVAGNQFLVIKKTWPNMLILLCGAVMNVVLNLILIPFIGIEGAAIATLLGYAISDVVCIIVLTKMELMKVSVKFILSSGLMVLFFVIWRMFSSENLLGGLFLAVFFSVLIGYLYRKDLQKLGRMIKNAG